MTKTVSETQKVISGKEIYRVDSMVTAVNSWPTSISISGCIHEGAVKQWDIRFHFKLSCKSSPASSPPCLSGVS